MIGSIKIDGISDDSKTGYSPEQIKTAYNLSKNYLGRGISVSIIGFFENPYIQNNLNIFSNEFSLPSVVIKHYGSGAVGKLDYDAFVEVSADTQWVHAISPLCNLNVVYADSYDIEGALGAVRVAKEIGSDIILMTFQAEFKPEYANYAEIFSGNHIFIASAGDFGAQVNFPSCMPACISVGGTSLKINARGRRASNETVWQGSGGGICETFDIPEYQSKMYGISDITGGKRGVPDVSHLANPAHGVAVYHSSVNDSFGWYRVGGTSISATIVAGILANAISSPTFPKDSYSAILKNLYNLAGGTAYMNRYNKFYDITIGNNGLYSARRGYDLCTGLGSLINL